MSLTLFLGSSARVAFHSSRVFSSANRLRATLSASPVVDRGAGRAGGAEGEAAELQSGGGDARRLLDEVHREAAHVRVLLGLQHFEAVGDGADRRDHVVADARAEQGGEIEGFQSKFRHRPCPMSERRARNDPQLNRAMVNAALPANRCHPDD